MLLGDGVGGRTGWNSMRVSQCCTSFAVKMSYLVRSSVVRGNETVNKHLSSRMAVRSVGLIHIQ